MVLADAHRSESLIMAYTLPTGQAWINCCSAGQSGVCLAVARSCGPCRFRKPCTAATDTMSLLQDIMCLIREAGGVLAAHDADGDKQLDMAEFSDFMQHFMAAAGFQLQDVIEDLITMAQTKVSALCLYGDDSIVRNGAPGMVCIA